MFKMPNKMVLKNYQCSVSGCNNLSNYKAHRGYHMIEICEDHKHSFDDLVELFY